MSAEARRWLAYAQENGRAASVCLESDLFNACLQNAQQAVEKALKALHLARGLPLKKTHSIGELRQESPHQIGADSLRRIGVLSWRRMPLVKWRWSNRV